LAAVRLAEVRYLSAVATQRLRLERDVPGSVRLLERADAVLAEADQASDISLRRALGAALSALRSAPRIDTVGLYLEVEQLAGLTDRLPLAAPVFRAEAPKVVEAPAPAGLGAWLWEKLSGLFRLRRTEVPSTSPLLSEGAAPLLQHGLRLTLSQAQLALLRGDGALWRASLEAAAQRVEKYGRPSRDRSRLLERLGALAATPVAVEGEVVRSAQEALEALNEALEARLGT
jgi:uroporphyrin-3 C-methyltransferase